MNLVMNQGLADYLSLLLLQVHQSEKPAPPIIAVYGGSPHFNQLAADFCVAAERVENTLVVSLDVGSVPCQTPEEGIFALIQQLFDALIKHAGHAEDRSQLLTAFYDVWNLSNAVKGVSKEERFAAFIRFTEYVAYPQLTALFRKSPRRVICVARAVERAECWTSILSHFVMETLLHAMNEVDVRCILFSNSTRPPDVCYGSSEEEAAERVRFVRVEMENHAESVCGEI